jgi:hypothetical protein
MWCVQEYALSVAELEMSHISNDAVFYCIQDDYMHISDNAVFHYAQDDHIHISDDAMFHHIKDDYMHISDDAVFHYAQDDYMHISDDAVFHYTQDDHMHISDDAMFHYTQNDYAHIKTKPNVMKATKATKAIAATFEVKQVQNHSQNKFLIIVVEIDPKHPKRAEFVIVHQMHNVLQGVKGVADRDELMRHVDNIMRNPENQVNQTLLFSENNPQHPNLVNVVRNQNGHQTRLVGDKRDVDKLFQAITKSKSVAF